MRMHFLAALGALALLAPAGGCGGGGAPSGEAASREEAVVKGIVRVRGRGLTSGEVIFHPGNHARGAAPRRAPIAKDGRFAITTYVGDNVVSVAGPGVDSNPNLATNQQIVPVEPGENARDIDL